MYHADLLGGIVSTIAGAKNIVWSVRGSFDRQRTSFLTKVTICMCSFFSWWLPKVIISNSEHALKVHIRTGYAKKKFVNIPNGCSLERFQPSETARAALLLELGLLNDITRIGMVARFDSHKDHANLLSALFALTRESRKVICLFVGSNMDATNQALVKQIENYGIQNMVKLLGLRKDVHKIMATLDLHVLSSVSESFPNVLVEAMACGTPCVTTDVGDAASIVGETGWIVRHSDPVSLAKAIGEALIEMQDSDKWHARRMACRKRVIENFSLDRMITSYNKVWNQALAWEKDV
jgi:glycosyltransferase involved in cell wall biosynthesis